MRKRRFQVSTSDEEFDPVAAGEEDSNGDGNRNKRGKREEGFGDEDPAAAGEVGADHNNSSGGEEKNENEKGRGENGNGEEQEEEDGVTEDAKPLGEVVKISGKGRKRKKHYTSFEYDGNIFELEDPVLLTPEDSQQKPYVAIIKDVTEDVDGNVMVTGQWFYRPEEAEKKGSGSWQSQDSRELFYSFHLDDVPAESVMHKCVVHFVPLNKQLPVRSKHPGFIVQKVYDTVEKKLWRLTDKDYEDSKQQELHVLIQKTRDRIGDLPDVTEEIPGSAEHDEHSKAKWNLRRKNLAPVDIKKDDSAARSDLNRKADTPGNSTPDISEYYAILSHFKVLTGDSTRDKWLEKLLQDIQLTCHMKEDTAEYKKRALDASHTESTTNDIIGQYVSGEKDSKDGKEICWPSSAVTAITALEKAAYESLGSEHHKYNQKMRQLDFNIKNNARLAKRLLNKELDPAVVLNMSPNELKDGFTAEEKAINEPEKPRQVQMTDAQCSRCTEKKVGVVEIIHTGGRGDRYQLECIACGNSWYAFRDEISSLTIDEPTITKNVGTAPWATAKFENVEKKLASPREHIQEPDDVFKKNTEPYIPVLDTQKSFNKGRNEELLETQKSFGKKNEDLPESPEN